MTNPICRRFPFFENARFAVNAIGIRITDKGITYEELGNAISVSEDVVRNWVSGRTKIPIDKACDICDLFGWPMDRLAVRGEWNDQSLAVTT